MRLMGEIEGRRTEGGMERVREILEEDNPFTSLHLLSWPWPLFALLYLDLSLGRITSWPILCLARDNDPFRLDEGNGSRMEGETWNRNRSKMEER
jgi:hypothetical protein